MSFKTILYEKKGGALWITLNRPEVYNAVNDQLGTELFQAFKEAETDKEVRVIVLTGGSGKAFCSGADLKDSEHIFKGGAHSEVIYKNYIPLIQLMRNIPKPVLCRLNGIAAGAGCSIALACDMIIANEEAELVEIFINIGLVPDAGSAYFLPRLVGRTKAFELMSKGSRLKAREAMALGIVNKAVPMEKLDAAVQEELEYFANAPTKTIGMIKKLLNQSYHSDLMQVMEMEATYQDHAGKTKDHLEGVTAFLQKRKAVFKGQ